MKNNITTTIVIATYNGQEFLSEQIDSILNQTKLPEEIIFVDDCSDDDTKKIILNYASLIKLKGINVHVTEQKKNVGYIKNFFNGIKQATQEIIFLCDQDDIWLPNKIEKYTTFFLNNSNILALHGNTNVINKAGDVTKENFQEYDKELTKLSFNKYLKKVNYPGMSLAFKNGEFKELLLSFEKELNLTTHDWFIGLMACLNEGFFTTNHVLTLRRHTGENVALKIASDKLATINDRINGIELYLNYYELSKAVIRKGHYSHYDSIEKYIANNNIRIRYLHKKSLLKALLNFYNYKYYPSIKSYLGDILLIIRS